MLGGMPHDESADLYSLGVLIWVLFTGGMPGLQPPVQPRPEARLRWSPCVFGALHQVHQHLYDWLLLRKCLEDDLPPFRKVGDVEDLPKDARDCVHLLVQPPEQRIRHAALREHAIFRSLWLPEYDAGPSEAGAKRPPARLCLPQVEAWLDQRGFVKRQR